MKYKNTQIALGKAGKELRRRMRQSLSQRGKNASGSLSKSLSYEQYVDKRYGPRLIMTGDSHATFVDQGVRGKFRNKDPRQAKSPYKFGTGTGKKGGLTKGIRAWRDHKGLRQWRDRKTGRYISYESQAFLIARAIYNRGLAPTYFIEDTVKRYEPEMFEMVGEALAQDGAEYLIEKLNVAFKK